MGEFTIYHNPRCSKSRQTLKILNNKGVSVDIVEYLKTPPSVQELKTLIKKLSINPSELVRNKEKLFKNLSLSEASDSELLEALQQNPILIERPIVVKGEKAVIGRPPVNVERLFSGG
jgi:arsenate reductase (glutaredoxin)